MVPAHRVRRGGGGGAFAVVRMMVVDHPHRLTVVRVVVGEQVTYPVHLFVCFFVCFFLFFDLIN